MVLFSCSHWQLPMISLCCASLTATPNRPNNPKEALAAAVPNASCRIRPSRAYCCYIHPISPAIGFLFMQRRGSSPTRVATAAGIIAALHHVRTAACKFASSQSWSCKCCVSPVIRTYGHDTAIGSCVCTVESASRPLCVKAWFISKPVPPPCTSTVGVS